MTNALRTMKEYSPFSPGQPVAPQMFVGRKEQVERILRSARQVRAGKQENLFVTGEYGIGKSSLVSYVRGLVREQLSLEGFHVFLGGVDTLEDMAQRIVESVLQQTHADGLLDTVRGFLGRYVKEVQFFGLTLNLEALKPDLPGIAHGFLPFLRQLHALLAKEGKGIALYLDDLNGIARLPAFGSFLKSLVDENATSTRPLPFLLALGGIPQRRHQIVANVSSVARIFDIVEVNPLTDAEVERFFQQAFESVSMKVSKDALQLLLYFSSGLPKLMHELGDAAFWADSDNTIDDWDAASGIMRAAENVGEKYFEPIRAALKSDDYRSILAKLSRTTDLKTLTFRKADAAKALNEKERGKLDNFLRKMKRLGALRQGEVRGEWVYPNRLLVAYLAMAGVLDVAGTIQAVSSVSGTLSITHARNHRRRLGLQDGSASPQCP